MTPVSCLMSPTAEIQVSFITRVSLSTISVHAHVKRVIEVVIHSWERENGQLVTTRDDLSVSSRVQISDERTVD